MEIQTVCLWKEPAAKLLALGHGRLLSWIPMMDATEDEMADAADQLHETHDQKVLETFHLLGHLRYGESVWSEFVGRRGLDMVTHDFLYENSSVYRRWMDNGERYFREKGMKKGLKEGLKKGMAQGMEQGMQQGMEQGKLEAERTLFRELVEVRFPSLLPLIPEDREVQNVDAIGKAFRAVAGADTEEHALSAIRLLSPPKSKTPRRATKKRAARR